MSRRRPPESKPRLALCRVRVPHETAARLHALASVQNRSIAAVLNDALRRYEKTLKKH